jgi:ABC-type phosphate transport system substrate-binding protein
MYTSGEPTPEVKAYVDWTQSEIASKITISAGYVPAPKR